MIATDESIRANSSTATAYASESPPAPPYSWGTDPHQIERAETLDDLVGELLRAVELLGDRRDLLLGELAHGLAQQPVVVREVEMHIACVATVRSRRVI